MNFKEINKGKYVIVRSNLAGVFAGTLDDMNETTVHLTNVRKLWFWKKAAAVQQLAMDGVSLPEECKFPIAVPSQLVKDWIEVIPATEKAEKSINSVPIWGRWD